MVEFRWIQMFLFLILLLHFTAVTEQDSTRIAVRRGDEVTLPCENVVDDQDKCDGTSWLFTRSPSTEAVELVSSGQIVRDEDDDKSDRLSVTENCSLVIKRASLKDPGLYNCRQFKSGQQQVPDSRVLLNIIRMSTSYSGRTEMLQCSVLRYERCTHTVRWLYCGCTDVDKLIQDLKTSQSLCSASVEFQTSPLNYIKRHDSFTCEVTDGNKVQLYPFLRPPSVTATTESSMTKTKPTRTTENCINARNIMTDSSINDTSTERDCSVVSYIMLVMRVVEVVLVTVITVLLIRAGGNRRPRKDNTVHHGGDGRDVTAVNHENSEDSSASVRLNNSNTNMN